MARRKREEEHENHERWLVSYADFITLLFAFFVVMYALSSINEGKYRVLSDSLTSAFRNVPINASSQAITPQMPKPPAKTVPAAKPNAHRKGQAAAARTNERHGSGHRPALAPLVQQGKVRVLETSGV